MQDELRTFLQATIALIAISNPLAALPVFLSLTRNRDRTTHRAAAIRVAVAVFAILSGAALVGSFVLELFGISLAAFRVGGGVVVTLTGLRMLQGDQEPRPGEEAETSVVAIEERLVVPVAMPIIAGPGSILTVMTLAVQRPGTVSLPAIVASVAIASATVWLVLAVAPRLDRYLGRRGQAIVTRFMGLILVAIGAQLVLTGVREFFAAPTL